jgi:hypothetical protein
MTRRLLDRNKLKQRIEAGKRELEKGRMPSPRSRGEGWVRGGWTARDQQRRVEDPGCAGADNPGSGATPHPTSPRKRGEEAP